ncbi:MAG: hypothetical protein GX206_03500 [Clostridiales bacterium]|nr:hypothetical protein [Clostridiales bacterium]
MKGKLIILAVFMSAFATLSGCVTKPMDSNDVKVIEKTKQEDTKKEADSSNKGTNKGGSDLNEKQEVLDKDTKELTKKMVEDYAKEAMQALKEKDMEKLSQLVHPEKGVRFSPYTFVEKDKDLVFSAKEVNKFMEDTTKYKWGFYDGSGELIELTFADYYKRFIYDADFINAPKVGYNEPIATGNTINNTFEVYKNAVIIEYHFPGIEEKYEGMDWRSLKLVFEKYKDKWYLVGVIHDEWTI